MTTKIAVGQITTSLNTVTQVVAARTGRIELRITGALSITLFGPNNGLSASNGYKPLTGDTLTLKTEEEVYALRINGNGVLSYLEIYEE